MSDHVNNRDLASGIPLLVQFASSVDHIHALGTHTVTKAVTEGRDEDEELEYRPVSPTASWLTSVGANYDELKGIWLRGGIPLVQDPSAALGTKTHTRVRTEAIDEDH